MFDVGGGELLLIFVAVLLLFGPKKIPEVMRSVGKGLRQFRQAQEDLKQQMRDLSADVEKMTEVQETVHIAPKPVIDDSIDNFIKPSFETEQQFPSFESEPIIPSTEQTLTNTDTLEPEITPKPAVSSVPRSGTTVKNTTPVKKVFDDTVFDG